MEKGKIITIADLPELVRDFLFGVEIIESVEKLLSSFSLGKEKIKVVLELTRQIVCGWYPLETLPAVFLTNLELDWETAEKFSKDFVGQIILPIDGFLGGIAAEQLQAWGVDPGSFVVTKVSGEGDEKIEENETPEGWVENFLVEANLNINNPVLKSRLEFLLTSFVSGTRNFEEIKSALTRSPKVGGMEMEETAALELLNKIKEKLGAKNFLPSEKKIEQKPKEIISPLFSPPPVRPAPLPVAVQRAERFERSFEKSEKIEKEDEAEIIKEKKKIEEKIAPVFVAPASANEAVEIVIREAGLVLETEELKKRLITVIESRLNGVRDAFETRDFLEKSQAAGGLGFTGGKLVKVMEVLEGIFDKVREKNEEKREQTKTAIKEQKIVKEAARSEEIKKENELKNKRYKEITGQDEKKFPPPATPVFSSPSIMPQPGRPQVVDIASPFRLSGPIEELGQMTLLEFRRLSADPEEAVQKIKDKIDLLEEQGYGKKIFGVRAWRASPINCLNLDLSREALLSGQPLEEIIDKRTKQGETMLKLEEVKALNHLNSQLRF